MKELKSWETRDGKRFDDEEVAKAHEYDLDVADLAKSIAWDPNKLKTWAIQNAQMIFNIIKNDLLCQDCGRSSGHSEFICSACARDY